jgi:hypothetical protein
MAIYGDARTDSKETIHESLSHNVSPRSLNHHVSRCILEAHDRLSDRIHENLLRGLIQINLNDFATYIDVVDAWQSRSQSLRAGTAARAPTAELARQNITKAQQREANQRRDFALSVAHQQLTMLRIVAARSNASLEQALRQGLRRQCQLQRISYPLAVGH